MNWTRRVEAQIAVVATKGHRLDRQIVAMEDRFEGHTTLCERFDRALTPID